MRKPFSRFDWQRLGGAEDGSRGYQTFQCSPMLGALGTWLGEDLGNGSEKIDKGVVQSGAGLPALGWVYKRL